MENYFETQYYCHPSENLPYGYEEEEYEEQEQKVLPMKYFLKRPMKIKWDCKNQVWVIFAHSQTVKIQNSPKILKNIIIQIGQ